MTVSRQSLCKYSVVVPVVPGTWYLAYVVECVGGTRNVGLAALSLLAPDVASVPCPSPRVLFVHSATTSISTRYRRRRCMSHPPPGPIFDGRYFHSWDSGAIPYTRTYVRARLKFSDLLVKFINGMCMAAPTMCRSAQNDACGQFQACTWSP